jgi:hypothetical protein
MSREHAIQNEIRNALAPHGMFFRANVGQGWTGQAERISSRRTVFVEPGDVVIRAARPFNTGLPTGFADLFGLVPRNITPADYGRTLAVFAALEVKPEEGRATKQQNAFLQSVAREGGISGIVRSSGAALALIGVHG